MKSAIPEELQYNFENTFRKTLKRFKKKHYKNEDIFYKIIEGDYFSRFELTTKENKASIPLDNHIFDSFNSEKFPIEATFKDIGYKHLTKYTPKKIYFNAPMTHIAKLLPSVKLKNKIYKSIGVNISNGQEFEELVAPTFLEKFDYSINVPISIPINKKKETATIAPYVSIDYVHPELIYISPRTIIGENAGIHTHMFSPTKNSSFKYSFGIISIGENCLIGGYANLLPGTIIEDNAHIGFGMSFQGYLKENLSINENAIIRGKL